MGNRAHMDSGTRRPLPADAPVAPAPDPAPLPRDVPTPGHVELCAASAFSFLAGASTPEELVAQSVSFGLPMVLPASITRGHLRRPKGVCVVPLEDLCAVADGLRCTVLPPRLDASGPHDPTQRPVVGGLPVVRTEAPNGADLSLSLRGWPATRLHQPRVSNHRLEHAQSPAAGPKCRLLPGTLPSTPEHLPVACRPLTTDF
jgi:hypothetical protein